MSRYLVFAAATLAALCPCGRSPAAYRSGLIPETTAVRHGLTRAWFTQIVLDSSKARVQDVVLHDGRLYVQTDRAMVHAIDAETGATLWAKHVGRPHHPSMTPGIGQDLLGVVNGSRLYVVNRYNGDLLYEVTVEGVPGAGAALSEKRAYVPMVNGLVTAYRLEPLTDPLAELGKIEKDVTDEQKAQREEDRRENLRLRQEYIPPLSCQSMGRALVQPLVTRESEDEEFVAWPTDRGYLNIGRVDRRNEDRLDLKYRLEADAGIAARPAYLPPDPGIMADSGVIYAASRDGFVHAIAEESGESLWRFSAGDPIIQPAIVIDQRVYVATQPGGMYCINAKIGSEVWWTPRIRQFIAASKQRVYAADKLGRVLVLNAKTGARLDTIPTANLPVKLINSQTDRLYLGTHTGLIQCLHEIELAEPFCHDEARKKRIEEQAHPTTKQKGLEELQPKQRPPAQEDPLRGGKDPFGGAGGGDAGGEEDPFGDAGAGDEAPGGGAAGRGAAPGGGNAGADDDDPFGGL